MDKKFGALRTLLNDRIANSDLREEGTQEDPRLLSELELLLASGGEDVPTW